jgi:hypothetical protein
MKVYLLQQFQQPPGHQGSAKTKPDGQNSSLNCIQLTAFPPAILQNGYYNIGTDFMTTAAREMPHCRQLQHLELDENEAQLPSSPPLLLTRPALYLHPSVNLPSKPTRMRQDK